ncbi:hypothetical protein EVAR_51902_1 [Eumeta japonica]|uniref:Uncharacterized protein n=1 Tax=Eumeta variegata TaxID=151549 RepID=A0A4C1XFL0_EUMVA|nr:hypothetical protein EVAR_51902_1 [Eumeta japonica]
MPSGLKATPHRNTPYFCILTVIQNLHPSPLIHNPTSPTRHTIPRTHARRHAGVRAYTHTGVPVKLVGTVSWDLKTSRNDACFCGKLDRSRRGRRALYRSGRGERTPAHTYVHIRIIVFLITHQTTPTQRGLLIFHGRASKRSHKENCSSAPSPLPCSSALTPPSDFPPVPPSGEGAPDRRYDRPCPPCNYFSMQTSPCGLLLAKKI